jgi:crotonobetainyl-CoA:carnitine CoA-transferase CaiB-like acyl-CoA transferase
VQQPLAGVHVLDVSEFGFVPSAAAVLGDWGADVVKVEKPSGDPLRSHGMVPGTDDFHVLIEHFNRNKRGIVLDLSVPAGRATLDRLLGWADVLITNFLPKTLAKLQLAPEQVREQHPDLIYVRGTGQGSRGPDADVPGFDGATWWARGGVGLAVSGPDGFAQMRAALGDGPTGAMLAGGVAAALYERERTGRGTIVETSLLQGAMWTLAPDLTSTALVGELPAVDLSSTEIGPLLGVYATADGSWLQLTMPQSRWWDQACRALGLDDVLDDPRYAEATRAEHVHELADRFAEAIRSRPVAEVVASLHAEGCVFARFASFADVIADPQVEANGFLPRHPTHPTGRVVASPVQFGGEPVAIRRGAPALGQHSEEVLADAGFTQAEIDELLGAGVVVQSPS